MKLSFHPTAMSMAVAAACAALPHFALAAAPAPENTAEAADTAVQLAPVTVKSDGLGSNTEGSGSYTTGAMRTATRMDMAIRDTPQSVSVVTRAQIDDQGLIRLDEVLAQVPGITVNQQDSERTSYTSRGFSINNFQVDGMPKGGNAPLQDTILYDRVEVVRGANGLMGSTGDPSAAVNLVRKRPGKELKGSARVSVARWDDRRAEIDVNVPLTQDGSVRARTAMAYQDRDSYFDMYHERKTVGMGIVEADLARATVLTAGFTFQHNNPTGASWGAIPYWNADGSLANLPRNFALTAPWSTWRNQEETVFAALDHQFDNGWKLHLGYARTDSRNNTNVVYGGAGYPNPATGAGMSLWYGVWGEGKNIDDNVDVYATGPFQLLGRRHVFIAGWNGGKTVSTSLNGTNNAPADKTIPNYLTWTGNIPMPTFTPDGSRTETETRLGGGYLAARLSLTDRLTAIVGARTSSYRTERAAFNTAGNFTGLSNQRKISDEITPYVGAVLDLSEDISAYASYTEVFNPQTAKDRNNNLLEPATGTNSELGVKGEFFDKRLNASAAVFRTLKKNIAELDRGVPAGFRLPDNTLAYVANARGITAKGIEFALSGQVTPDWNINGGYTYVDAQDADGERAVPTAPRHQLRLATSYRLDRYVPGLKVGGSYALQSSTWSESWYGRPGDAAGAPLAHLTQAGYGLLGAMASYEINRNFSAQLNVSNLLDKHYYRTVGFYDSVFWGEPRNIRLSLTARF